MFVVYVAIADGGAQRGGGVAIVPVSSSKPGTVRDSSDFIENDADDAVFSMCTDNEGDELLTNAFNDMLTEADLSP